MTFEKWWKRTGQLDEGGKDDWRECWEDASAEMRRRCAAVCENYAIDFEPTDARFLASIEIAQAICEMKEPTP